MMESVSEEWPWSQPPMGPSPYMMRLFFVYSSGPPQMREAM